MTLFDWIAGLVLVFALIKGGVNGLVKELASVVALAAGLLGAIYFGRFVENWMGNYFEFEYLGVLAFLFVFVLIVIGVNLMAKALDKLLESAALGSLNRLAGALFSVLKYAFFISIFISVYNFFSGEKELLNPPKSKESLLYDPLKGLAPMVFPYLEFHKGFVFPEKDKTDGSVVASSGSFQGFGC